MSSGFSGGGADFNVAAGLGGRYVSTSNPQVPYRSRINEILKNPVSQIVQRRSDLMGKRSLAEYQAHHHHLQQQNSLLQQQRDHRLSLYLRNVKQRIFQQESPISTLSPVDLMGSDSGVGVSVPQGLPILQQLRPQSVCIGYGNGVGPCYNPSMSSASYRNLVPDRDVGQISGQVSEKKMMNRLQELEKQLLDDIDEEQGDDESVIMNSEWAEKIQNLLSPAQIVCSSSPTSSSSSSSCSSSASPSIACPRQPLMEAASSISEGKTEVATEILTRIHKVANARGSSEQRLTAFITTALRSRINPTEYPPPVMELFSKEHAVSTQMLYDCSPCFKFGFMAANLAILESISEHPFGKLHVLDFNIGHASQYIHLIHSLAAHPDKPKSLKVTTFIETGRDDEDRLKVIGNMIRAEADKVGIFFNFELSSWKSFLIHEDEALAVNLAFQLYKLPDESVTTENLRDDLLRRVKRLSPTVVTLVEQEMNANTSPFTGRVAEACAYYSALLESLEASLPNRDDPERVRVEEGLSRRLCNSIACEGKDRMERCEVLGKWTARMSMAGYKGRALSQEMCESLRERVNSVTHGNPGFAVKEEKGSICIGWKGRTLTVTSAWF